MIYIEYNPNVVKIVFMTIDNFLYSASSETICV